ncbi:regulator [Salmonella enterica]|nr:regulator [Salmonella enterica]EBS4353111.1 regulator [Salmonella enterica subsp. enterica serovar Galiema]ECV1943103.1 regulator [Salmonella enterica subsp. enterica serovar Galiema]EDB2915105.1 regulator [Salmonella enterica subsp. enterica serovar Galiema]EDD0934979.1 regulator [Salmonella enterica subsp. enterica serovar Galiema]
MTNFIAHNSVTRRYLKRGELIAKRRAEASQNALQKANDMHRVDRATSLGSLRDKKEQEAPQKTNRLYYSKPTREMGVTCTGRQKQRGKSIPAYYD